MGSDQAAATTANFLVSQHSSVSGNVSFGAFALTLLLPYHRFNLCEAWQTPFAAFTNALNIS
jgi:hypothetical protein